MKFPRRATVCKRGVKKNNGWIKTEASRPSAPKTTRVADARGGQGTPLLSHLSFLQVHLEPNENKVSPFPGQGDGLLLTCIKYTAPSPKEADSCDKHTDDTQGPN